MKHQFAFLFLCVLCVQSCNKPDKKFIVTEKIQYDVSIKNMHTDYDPWIENIEKSIRIEFVQSMLEAAYSGKIKAYDYFNNLLSLDEVKNIGVDTIYRTLIRTTPPYDEYDTIIVNRIEIKDINKVRFVEEWKMDKETLLFEKRIISIAPVIDKYDSNGNRLGKQPLFFIYPNSTPEK